jgi:hypothetical protein
MRLAKRLDWLGAYSAALRRRSDAALALSCEIQAGTPACASTLQALDDARVIWTAAQREYVRYVNHGLP